MKKEFLTVALLAVLGSMATSCQKENISDFTSESAISEASTVYTVHYAVNGIMHSITLQSEEEYDALIMGLMDLAQKGYMVEFYDNHYNPNVTHTKETITYSTPSNTDATSWSKQKTKDGYRVQVTYDNSENVYVCIAYKS